MPDDGLQHRPERGASTPDITLKVEAPISVPFEAVADIGDKLPPVGTRWRSSVRRSFLHAHPYQRSITPFRSPRIGEFSR